MGAADGPKVALQASLTAAPGRRDTGMKWPRFPALFAPCPDEPGFNNGFSL